MAEQATVAAPFPAPPPFYRHFTKSNLAELRRLRKEAGVPSVNESSFSRGNRAEQVIDVHSLPTELRCLIPPEPPSDGKYKSFGTAIDRNEPEQTLEQAGIEQVYSSHPSARLNPQPHLIAMARSLLACFLGLAGTLSVNPDQAPSKSEDLQTLMYNIHHLINQYRPHQARETLILLMEERVDKMKRDIGAIDEAKGKVAKLLAGLQEGSTSHTLPGDTASARSGAMAKVELAERRHMHQRASFRSLEDEMG